MDYIKIDATCWKCMKHPAYIFVYDDDSYEPQLCKNCKRAKNKALKNWNDNKSDFRSDRSYYEHNVELSPELANRLSYERWLEENS